MYRFKKILLILLFSFPLFSLSQTIERFSFTSASGFYSNNIQIDFSFGQTIINKLKNENVLTSGFQQPESSINSKNESISKDSNINFDVKLFPNPISDFAYIYITSDFDISLIKIKAFNLEGKEIFVESNIYEYNNFIKIELNLTNFKQGNYIIKTFINNSYTKSFKIVKI